MLNELKLERSIVELAIVTGPLVAQRQEELTQPFLRDIQQVASLLRVREREGEGSRYDRPRAERETSGLRADLAFTRARARNEKTVLLSYLPADITLAPLSGNMGSRPFATTAAERVSQALINRADFRAQSSRLAQSGLKEQDRLRQPEPMITVGMKRTHIGPERDRGKEWAEQHARACSGRR